MARTVADVELMFRVVAGFDSGDAMASSIPVREYDDKRLQTITVGYFEEYPDVPVTQETRAAVRKAATALHDAGIRVEPFCSDVLRVAREHWWTLFVRLAAEMLMPEFSSREAEVPTILTYSGRPPSKEDLLAAWFERDQLRLSLARQMSEMQVILCPVCSVPAFHHGEREWNIGGKSVTYMDAMSYSQWFNLLGNPALVLPVGESAEGLPIGVQVVGKPNAEGLIIKIGRVLEDVLGSGKPAPLMLEASVAAK